MFNFVRYGQTIFQSGYIILHSHHKCMTVSVNRECNIKNWRVEGTKREYWEMRPTGTAIIPRTRVVVNVRSEEGVYSWVWCNT